MSEQEEPVKDAAVPGDKISLRLLLTNGKKADFLFNPTQTVAQVKAHVVDNWPKEWETEKQEKADAIRLLYRGRFLEDQTTLESHKLPLGETTTLHLVPKPAGSNARGGGSSSALKCFCC